MKSTDITQPQHTQQIEIFIDVKVVYYTLKSGCDIININKWTKH